jgi:hypothetical protein
MTGSWALNGGNVSGMGTLSCGAITSSSKIETTSTAIVSEDLLALKNNADNVAEYVGMTFETHNGITAAIRSINGPSAGDNRLGLYTSTDGGTNLLERLSVAHNGYVGIGQTAPTAELEVAGKIYSTDTSSDSIKTAGGVSATSYYGVTADGSDNTITGFGTGSSSTRGSVIFCFGNEYATNARKGKMEIYAGLGDNSANFGTISLYNANGDEIVQFGTESSKTDKSTAFEGRVKATIASDTDSDTDDVLTTTIADTDYGLVIVRESTGTEACVFLIAGGTIEKIGTDATFTVTKDNASTYNVYFEDNVIKVQNKVGDNKNIAVGLYAI